MKKLRVGIVFGGRSGEHEVSVTSAGSIFKHIDRGKYEPIAIKIEKDGQWTLPDQPPMALSAAEVIQQAKTATVKSQALGGGEPAVLGALNLDVVFPVLHGPYGEDGTIQGLLELANIPYVGPGVLASAAGMDKAVMKVLFAARGLPLCAWRGFVRAEWDRDRERACSTIVKALGYPMFVKPANLGSSVGISKVKIAGRPGAGDRTGAGSSIAKWWSKPPCRTRARSNARCSATTSPRRRCRARSSRRASSTTTKPSTSTMIRRA